MNSERERERERRKQLHVRQASVTQGKRLFVEN
jgi:hypothetical protein